MNPTPTISGNSLYVPAPFTGDAIDAALAAGTTALPMLIPELIIQGGCTFIVAAPKVGKTTIALQLAISLTSGTSVFGGLPVAEPCQVYYFAFETSFHRFIGKAERMRRTVPFISKNLIFDPLCHGKDATNERIQDWYIARVKQHTDPKRLKLIIIDPAYKMVPGGLGKDEPAGRFCAFLGRLSQETGAATLVLHHSHREKWDGGEIIVERNPSFGSVWLIAHPDLMLQLEKLESGEGVSLRVSEDREEICRPKMKLLYNPETGTVNLDGSDLDADDRVLDFFTRQTAGASFTTKEVAASLGCSIPTIKRQLGSERLSRVVNFVQTPGRPTIWRRL